MSTSIGSIKRYLTGFFILGIWLSQAWAPTQATSPSPQATPNVPQAPGSTNYLPLVISSQIAQIQLTSASTHDAASLETSFLPGSPINFVAGGANLSTFPGYVNLRWTLSGPCGTSEIFNNLLTLQPGAWSHTYPSTTTGCPGIYLSTVELTNGLQTTSLSTLFIVFPPS